MSEKSLDLIEKYLDRVRVYLPTDSEESLIEIRTHLLEEAESIGDGSITRGSAMMAIERFGDPKDAANALAGTGKRVGPVPTEYTQPLMRMIIVIAAISAAFLVGAYVIGLTFPDWFDFTTSPVAIPFVIAQIAIYALIILGVIYLIKRETAPTEKTAVEEFLGIGSGAFKPNPRSDAVIDMFFGAIIGLVLLLPQFRITLNPALLVFADIIAILMFSGAIKGLLFFVYGENNVNLMFEIFLSVSWVILCVALINIGWGFDYVWSYSDSLGWEMTNMIELMDMIPFLSGILDTLWALVIFIIVVVSIWQTLMAIAKVSMYIKAEKGWWWTGNFGEGHLFRHRLFRRTGQ